MLWLLALAFVAIAATVILLLPAPGQGIASGPPPLAYVGARGCEECHADETLRWRGSHHALAMQPAGEGTVLGDFANARFSEGGMSARFYRKGAGYFVRAEGADGRSAERRVAYSFGTSPLQQYLIEMPGGRYQAFGVAWDSRAKREGGQRWFQLYPGQRVDHRDVLHWSKPSQNWNSQCAECHSTGLVKGYRWPEDRFVSTFAEVDVACEACHGPGSRHVSWAEQARSRGRAPSGDPGLVVRFSERRSRSWVMDVARGIAKPSQFPKTRVEVEMCARCHARRGPLGEDYTPGRPLTETHRPALLEQGLYYADGQIRDEVYEWGSFLQSRMYAAGVTCSDCHDPHDLQPKVSRDDVCSSCHQPERFATRRHHFHREGGRGASCVACHMRSRSYMVIQERHDHSFRVPRPDLTVSLGAENAPNTCNDCHRQRSALWAARAVRRWYPQGRSGTPHWAEALQAGRTRAVGAERALVALGRDRGNRRSCGRPPSRCSRGSSAGPRCPPSRRRRRIPRPWSGWPPRRCWTPCPSSERLRAGVSLLWDPERAVRVEAVSAFADVPDEELESEQRAAFDRSLDEYLLAQRTNAERPESHVNLGIVYAKRGRLDEARRAYEAALRIAPWFAPAYVNLADLLRIEGLDADRRRDPAQGSACGRARGIAPPRARAAAGAREEAGPGAGGAGPCLRAGAGRAALRARLRPEPALRRPGRRGARGAARRSAPQPRRAGAAAGARDDQPRPGLAA